MEFLAAHALEAGQFPALRALAAEKSPVRQCPVPPRTESARPLPAEVPAAPGPRAGVLVAGPLCARDRRGGCVARVEMFQIVQAIRRLRQVSVRDPCLFQLALNGPKCNGNYAATGGKNFIASRAELGFCLRRETKC